MANQRSFRLICSIVSMLALLFLEQCGGSDFSGAGIMAAKSKPSANSSANSSSGAGKNAAGSNSASGNSGNSSAKNGSGANGSSGDGGLGLAWNWPCSQTSAQGSMQLDGSGAPTITGAGTFQVDPASLKGGNISFSGSLCAPSQLQRDIVFIVDVSGSMGPGGLFADPSQWNHDPLANGGCGRLTAIQTLANQLSGQNGVKMGLVTFSDNVVASSGSLVSTASALQQSLLTNSGQSNIGNVICAANGGTNYDAPLSAAQQMLASDTTPGTVKEVYFISDGQPNGGDGIAISNQLKSNGTTIATIMLIGDNSGLLAISSADSSGHPLNTTVSNANQLSQALETLANTQIVGAQLSYRPVGASSWTTKNLMPSLNNLNFSAQTIQVDPASATNGIEVDYLYWDNHGNRYEYKGTLTWKAS